ETDPYYAAFNVLYYTGMRIGELLALTVGDIDLEKKTVSITKTLHRTKKKDIITPPKTDRANRTVTLPLFLCDILKTHISRIYAPEKDTLVFLHSKSSYLYKIKHHAVTAGIKPIRIHDLRHSHASLLIELGFSALLVSERLGHENVSTTLNIYAHLFPSKQTEVADRLDKLK
ncbi:MAG TPA: site-specific integrase, partial [Candidatus Alectryocaccobium stercorigallinarum]|nr:site-specific integrase [Candidatus Alectryocaccobium stercorigallinarum]